MGEKHRKFQLLDLLIIEYPDSILIPMNLSHRAYLFMIMGQAQLFGIEIICMLGVYQMQTLLIKS